MNLETHSMSKIFYKAGRYGQCCMLQLPRSLSCQVNRPWKGISSGEDDDHGSFFHGGGRS
jgi:hypothetical protein